MTVPAVLGGITVGGASGIGSPLFIEYLFILTSFCPGFFTWMRMVFWPSLSTPSKEMSSMDGSDLSEVLVEFTNE